MDRLQQRGGRKGTTYLVEALLLLLCLLVVAALVMVLFAASLERAERTRLEQDAIQIAQTVAERFAADPLSVPNHATYEGYDVVCEVTSDVRPAGVLYEATIRVSHGEEALFELSTDAYAAQPSSAGAFADEQGGEVA